jgi:hypothetical protein
VNASGTFTPASGSLLFGALDVHAASASTNPITAKEFRNAQRVCRFAIKMRLLSQIPTGALSLIFAGLFL